MRRIAFYLLWIFLALPVHAQEYDYVAGSGGAAGCTEATSIVGDTNVESTSTGIAKGQMWVYQFTASLTGCATGTLNTANYRHGNSTGNQTQAVCIYADNGSNAPTGDPLGQSVAQTDGTANTTITGIAMSGTAPTVTHGTKYWVGMICDNSGTNNCAHVYDNTADGSKVFYMTGLTGTTCPTWSGSSSLTNYGPATIWFTVK